MTNRLVEWDEENFTMTNVELDDTTAKALVNAAQSQDMSVAEFVRSRILGSDRNGSTNSLTAETFDSDIV